MRSTRSARASPSRRSRPRAYSQARRRSAFRSACMPISCRTCMAPRSPRDSARFRPIISNMPTRTASRRWPGPARSPCSAGRVLFHPRTAGCRRSTPCAGTACRSRWRPTATPGTSPLTSLLLTMNMGATLFRLTVDECIAGVTREAARALGLFEQPGAWTPANPAISRSGISSGRPNWSTEWDSIRFIPGCGGALPGLLRPAPTAMEFRHDPHRQCPRDPCPAWQPSFRQDPGSPKRRCAC